MSQNAKLDARIPASRTKQKQLGSISIVIIGSIGIASVAANVIPLATAAIVFPTLMAMIALMAFVPPLSQPLAYHAFADNRNLCCGAIPNSLDVLSNIPFALVGLYGCNEVIWNKELHFTQSWERSGWTILFLGSGLVSIGSAYYHWAPNNARLVWDRLPMTIAFMALFTLHLEERIGGMEVLLPILIMMGLLSCWYWALTDDLRPYFFVQFYPMLMIPILLAWYPPMYTHAHYVVYTLGWYAAAKVTETYDRAIYRASGNLISGHTIKHLLAGVAVYYILLTLQLRQPVKA